MKKEEKKPLDVATSISAAQGPETTYPCCREGFRLGARRAECIGSKGASVGGDALLILATGT
jgi:hypothetical protein